MRSYRFEAWADSRPVNLTGTGDVVRGSNVAVAFTRAARRTKSLLRRGTKTVTLRLYDLGSVSKGQKESEGQL